MPLDVNEFASKIKEKYPEYKDVDNKLLTQKMIEKYPEYKDKVSLGTPKKKEATESQLKQPKVSSSSATQGTEEQKPSVSSGSVKNNVFTGYPGKEKNEYKIDQGKWLRKEPSGQWEVVNNSGSIIGLNKQFKKNIVPTADLSKVNSSLMDKSEEEVVPFLKSNYGNLGFVFEQVGVGTDKVRVMTKDGANSEIFHLDNWTNSVDSAESIRLKAFLKEHTETLDRQKQVALNQQIQDIKNANKAPNVEGVDKTSDMWIPLEQRMKKAELEKEYTKGSQSRLNKLTEDLKKAKQTKGTYDDNFVKARISEYYGNSNELSKQKEYVSNNLQDINRTSEFLKKENEDAQKKYEQYKVALDENGGVETEELKALREDFQSKDAYVKANATALNEISNDVIGNAKKLQKITVEHLLNQQKKGTAVGAVRNAFIRGFSNFADEETTDAMVQLFGSDYTTEEFENDPNASLVRKALTGISRSIGAATSGAVVGPYGSMASLVHDSYESFKKGLDENPDLKSMSEEDKEALSMSVGLVGGILEEFGVTSVMKGTKLGNKFTNYLLSKALKGLPAKATTEMIEAAVKDNLGNLIKSKAIKIVGGSLIEGSTEFTQDLAESSATELYDLAKGKDLFSNKDWLSTAGESFIIGAIGGGLVKAPSEAVGLIKDGFDLKNNKKNAFLDEVLADEQSRNALKDIIKSKILSKELTPEQAAEQIKAIDEVSSTLNKINPELSNEDKYTSFNLIQEKKKLEKDIQGKDEASVFAQKERINAINEELKTISLNNATKESTEQQQEIPTESNISERQGTTEGQQEVGKGEGSERTAEKPEANISDSNIASEEEEINKKADIERRRQEEYNTQYNALVAGQVLDNDGEPVYEEDKGIGANSLSTLTDKKYGHGHIRTSGLNSLEVLEKLLDGSDFSGMFGEIGSGVYNTWDSGKFIIVSNNINPTTNNKLNLNEIEIILNAGLSPFAQELANKYPNVVFKDFNGKKYDAKLDALKTKQTEAQIVPEQTPVAQVIDSFDDVKNANNENDLARLYNEEVGNLSNVNEKEKHIHSSISKVKKDSYVQFGDANNISQGMAKTYFRKDGLSIDQVAQEASQSLTGEFSSDAITPQDVVEYMNKYPNGFNPATPSGNPKLRAISEKYKEITGKQINSRIAKIKANNIGNESKVAAIDSKLTQAIQTAGLLKTLEDNINDEGFWTQFPGGFTKEEYEQIKKEYNETSREELDAIANPIESRVNWDTENDEISGGAIEQKQEETSFEEIKNLDVTDKTNLQKVQSFLDNALNDLDAFGKETLGMNLPVAVARVVLKTVKTLVDAGVSLEQAFKQAAQKHNVKEVDIADTLTALSNKKKETQASTAAKNISKKPVTKVTVNEATALKDQLKLEVKAAREGAKSVKDQQNELLDKVRKMGSKGVITTRQTRALLNKIRKLNLNNDVAVNDFFKYSEKIFNDAEYAEKLGRANNLRKSAKKKVKNKDNNQGPIIALVNDFVKINTDNVADLDEYIEMANKLNNAAKSSRVTKLGVAFKEATSIAEANAYITKEIERQEKETKRELLRKFDDLVRNGLISDSMTLKEMEEFIKSLDGEEDVESKEEKEALTREYVKAKFDELSASIKDILDSDDTISDADRKLMSDVLGIDLDNVGIRDSFRFVEAMDNFQMNGITSGVEAMMRSYTGVENAKELQSSGFKSFELKRLFSKAYGKFRAKQTYSLPILFENMFAGESAARVFMKKSGYNDVANGKVAALVKHNEKLREHKKLFSKSKPNGKNFNDAENIHERGIFAYLIRSVNDDPTAVDSMFQKRLDNVKRTIENHRNTKSEKHQKIADSLEKVAKKMGIFEDNPTIESIESKVDEINKKDIQWWVDSWSEIYPELSDVSLSVYNTVLARDAFYTTDTIGNINRRFDLTDETGGFSVNTADTQRTGVLHENNRFKIGEKNSDSIIDFNFDANQDKAFKAALVDVNTAGPIRQLKAFMDSKYISDIVATKEDLEVLKERLYNYVKRTKGKAVSEDDIKASASFNRKLNRLSLLNTSLILGRPSQYLLQTVPIIANTMINTSTVGRFDIGDAVSRSAIKFLSRTNRTIAIRALDARAHIEKAERYLDKNPEALSEKAGDAFDKVNEFWLKYTLQNADVWVANASWLTYYQDYLHKNKGVATGSIDWDSHEVDEDAADYAQQKVDRQQNISDPHMAGEWQQSSSATKKILTKVIMPFSNFAMNQKSRLNADLRALRFGTAEDKKEAWFSIAGMATEQAIFRGVQAAIGIGLYNLGSSLFGYDDDDEEEEKIKKRYLDSSVKQGLSDVFSPNPALDGLTVSAINFLSESSETVRGMFSDDTELNNAVKEKNAQLEEEGKPVMGKKEEIAFRDKYIQENIWQLDDFVSDDKLGMFSIAIKKGGQFKDLVQKVNSENGFMVENKMTKEETRKFLIPEDREKLQSALVLDAAYLLRALVPTEVNTMLTNQEKSITKRALNAKQYDNYEQIKKEYKKDLSANWRYDLIQSSKSINSIMNGIEMFDDYNMTEKKYDDFKAAKKIAKDKKISWDDKSLSYFILDELDAGRKPSQIKFE